MYGVRTQDLRVCGIQALFTLTLALNRFYTLLNKMIFQNFPLESYYFNII